MIVSLGLLLQMWILWCLQIVEFIPLPLGKADMVALVACLHEGGISDQFDCSHTMNLNVCWCRRTPTHPHTPVDRDEHPAPTAFRNPDKNNVALENLCCVWVRWLQGSHCLLKGAGISASAKELAKKLWHSHCRLSTLQPTVVRGQQKSWSNYIYQSVHLAYAPHSE